MGDSSHSLRTSVHKALGGGQVADVLLWRKWCGGAVMLVSATTMLFRTRYCNVTMSKLSPEGIRWLSVTRGMGLGFQGVKLLASFCSVPSVFLILTEFL